MHTLLTVISALAALLSTWCFFRCLDAQQRASDGAHRLRGMSARVIALEGALESLRLQHQKLHGKFHAAQRGQDSETPDSSPDVGRAPPALRTAAPYCENFQLAQVNGPLSPAASCECGYCVEMRDRRRELKADLLPAARVATLGAPRTRE